ncbi:MAG TPA: glycine cleavage T C-terminal barrel domain-containing protein [Miltoncostaeaceae bacterium]|nr:glycine cleavage T C-terminal barrel domain-containing protein [Miltoncostaeaceae bacterium]
MSTAVSADAAAGYARLRDGAPAWVAEPVALIWVEGPDAASFLHGLLSNDVASLAIGASADALLLDAKGHLQAAVGVHRDGDDALTLVLDPGDGDAVAAALDRYHFSEDLEILGPEPAWALTVSGMPAPAGPSVPGLLPGTVRAVVEDPAAAGAALPGAQAPPEALEMARVAAGLARVGVDTGPSTLVQEAALEDRAVSFTKGCYLGQETVARLQFRGKANRALRGVLLDGPAAAGTPVTAGGREVGRLTSVAPTPDLGVIGLAILRREVAPGDEVEAGGVSGRVAGLPFGRR